MVMKNTSLKKCKCSFGSNSKESVTWQCFENEYKISKNRLKTGVVVQKGGRDFLNLQDLRNLNQLPTLLTHYQNRINYSILLFSFN
jgi:hypothetical protein